MKKLLLSTFLCLNLLAFAAFARTVETTSKQNSKAEKIDRLIESYAANHLFNGSVLVAQKGKEIFKKGYGSANMEWEIPNAADTKFRIGSVTKQFTATLILQLKQEGKLNLQAKITDYLS